MFSFEVTILGASGGPDAGETQCFMVRPGGCKHLNSVCVDGGAGVRQIARILVGTYDSSNPKPVESLYVNDFEPAEQFFDANIPVDFGFASSIMHMEKHFMEGSDRTSTYSKALRLYRGIKDYYITHPHLDHIAAMVLNSPLIFDGKYMEGKQVWGLPFTVDGIEKHVFNDVVWPNLLNVNGGRLKLNALANEEIQICKSFPQWDIIPFQVHHGNAVTSAKPNVYSTIYLFRDRYTDDSIVICGDVEPDILAGTDCLLDNVWQYLAKHTSSEKVKGIIIECSSFTDTSDRDLYGHLSPKYVIKALSRLKELYNGGKALAGLNVVVSHVKKIDSKRDPRLIILEELRTLAKNAQLNDIKFSMAIEGYTFHF